MESLLSLSFDYLSSADGTKLRKGLRQLEGLLAQICLSPSSKPPSPPTKPSASSPTKSTSAVPTKATPAVPNQSNPSLPTQPTSASPTKLAHSRQNSGEEKGRAKALGELKQDAAFREFFKLQEGFEWNVAIRLVGCLERLMGRGSNGQNDLLIISTLDLLQGILLIHPSSRALFERELHMNLLLDLLDPSNCPAIQSSTLLTLVTTLLDQPRNTRTFETLDGLLTVTSLFKSRSTSREVKMKLIEFLYFYLMPEAPSNTSIDMRTPNAAALQRSPSKRVNAVSRGGNGPVGGGRDETRTTEEKQALLGRYLSNVEGLVEDLRQSVPLEMRAV